MSWCAVDTKHKGHVQGQQSHHDAGLTPHSDISSAAAAALHSGKPGKN